MAHRFYRCQISLFINLDYSPFVWPLKVLVSARHAQGIFCDYSTVPGHTLSKLLTSISRNGASEGSLRRLFGELVRHSASISLMFGLGFPLDLHLLFVLTPLLLSLWIKYLSKEKPNNKLYNSTWHCLDWDKAPSLWATSVGAGWSWHVRFKPLHLSKMKELDDLYGPIYTGIR